MADYDIWLTYKDLVAKANKAITSAQEQYRRETGATFHLSPAEMRVLEAFVTIAIKDAIEEERNAVSGRVMFGKAHD